MSYRTGSISTKLAPKNKEPERAPREESASFPTALNRDTTTAGCRTNPGVGDTSSDVWASTFYEVKLDNKHADINEDQTLSTSAWTIFSATTLAR